MNTGLFCLLHKESGPARTAPSVDCVSRIHLIKDNSLIKIIGALFLERLFPHSIICKEFLNLVFHCFSFEFASKEYVHFKFLDI